MFLSPGRSSIALHLYEYISVRGYSVPVNTMGGSLLSYKLRPVNTIAIRDRQGVISLKMFKQCARSKGN